MCPDDHRSRSGVRLVADGAAALSAENDRANAQSDVTQSQSTFRQSRGETQMNPSEPATDAQQSQFIDKLVGFTREHKANQWSGSLASFLDSVVRPNPYAVARTSHQYLWDMVRWNGREDEDGHFHCNLLEDELFGVDDSIARVIGYFKAAAAGSEVGRRLLLLLGPPSGGKSSLVILLKRGMEEYCYTDAGAIFAVKGCPIHESPLHLIPHSLRPQFRQTYGAEITGELCPSCRLRVEHEFAGDFMKMPVERIFVSEAGRVGIGTYAPHDPTTADLADLVGSVDLSKVAEFGDEGDPRPHQPRRVPQVPAGARERGAARPDGDHPGPVHAQLSGGSAHLRKADIGGRAGVPRGAPRSARAAHGGGVRDPHPAARGRRQGCRLHQARAAACGRGSRRRQPFGGRAAAREIPRRGFVRRVAALRDQRSVRGDHQVEREEPHDDGCPARAQGCNRERCAHRPEG